MVTAFLIRVYDNVKNNLKLHKCCEAPSYSLVHVTVSAYTLTPSTLTRVPPNAANRNEKSTTPVSTNAIILYIRVIRRHSQSWIRPPHHACNTQQHNKDKNKMDRKTCLSSTHWNTRTSLCSPTPHRPRKHSFRSTKEN